MIYFDAHVHIQKTFNVEHLLTIARANLSRQRLIHSPGGPGIFCLLLSEAGKFHCFSKLKNQVTGANGFNLGGWRIQPTKEVESLLAVHDNSPEDRLFLLAGRQVVTAERLEVLALITANDIPDGLSLMETVDTIRNQGGLVVLPWGAGKWLGKRGKLLDVYLKSASPDCLFVGDIGGRPLFWPTPRSFNTAADRGIRLLPGSDPLPLDDEQLRIGSYGAMVAGECLTDTPAEGLKALLTASDVAIIPFGRRLGALRFFKTQLALRLLKI